MGTTTRCSRSFRSEPAPGSAAICSRRRSCTRARTASSARPLSYLLSQQATLQFGEGDWDAALATAAQMYPGSVTYRWSLFFRAWIAVGREGPEAALPISPRSRSWRMAMRTTRSRNGPSSRAATHRPSAASEARAHLDALAELVARYPARRGRDANTARPDRRTGPRRHARREPPARRAASGSVSIEAEIRTTGRLPAAARSQVAAARAILAGDTAAAAATSRRARGALMSTSASLACTCGAVVTMLTAASDAWPRIGAEWAPVVARARAFAERTGAKYWLAVLEKTGL